MAPETHLVFGADRSGGGGCSVAPARLSFAIGRDEAWWREALPVLARGAAMVELDRVAQHHAPHTVLDVPHAALAALLQETASRGLLAEVLDVLAHIPAIDPPQPAQSEDPGDGLCYRIAIGPQRSAHEGARLMPACCARAAGAHASGLHQLAALVAKEGTGPLLPHAALAPLGLSPLGHMPCSLSCEPSLAAVESAIEGALALGLAEAAGHWRSFPQRRVHTSIAGNLLEVETDGFRFAMPLAAAGHPRVFPLLPGGAPAPSAADAGELQELDVAQHSRSRAAAWENARALRTETRVAHYPCGQGYLLDAVHTLRPAVQSLGLEPSPQAALRARARLQDRNAEIVVMGALEDTAPFGATPFPGTLFIGAEALLAANAEERIQLLGWIIASQRAVLVGEAGTLAAHGGIDALAQACGVPVVPGRPGRITAEVAGALA